MKNVALYLSGVNNIKGGGGAERFFADFFLPINPGQIKNLIYTFLLTKLRLEQSKAQTN